MADAFESQNSIEANTVDAPLPSVQIRWAGLVGVVAFVGLLAVVARVLGPTAAALVTVATLFGLAAWTVWTRRSKHRGAVMTHGEWDVPYLGIEGAWGPEGGGFCGGGSGVDC